MADRLTDADIEAGQTLCQTDDLPEHRPNSAGWCIAHSFATRWPCWVAKAPTDDLLPRALAELAKLRAAARALFASVPREETGTEFPTEWEHWEEWDVLAALVGDTA